MTTGDVAQRVGMTEQSKSSAPPTNSLFEEPWWLDAVAPGSWDAVEVQRGGEVVARLPFVRKRRYGLTLLGMPRLTQQLGPWIRPAGGKLSSRMSWQTKLIEELLGQLPPHDIVRLNLSHGLTSWLPFYWAGYRGTVNYTYQLQDLTDLDRVWAGFDGSVRTDVQKAKRQLTVRDDLPVSELLRLNALTFSRQGLKPSYDREMIFRLDQSCSARDARRMLFAEDASGRVHAAAYIVWDERSAYYLMGGSDPELRSSGAMTLLLWSAIQHAATVSKVFDFEGSMIRPVEQFCRAFGTVQVPYFHVVRANRRAAMIDAVVALSRAMRRGRA